MLSIKRIFVLLSLGLVLFGFSGSALAQSAETLLNGEIGRARTLLVKAQRQIDRSTTVQAVRDELVKATRASDARDESRQLLAFGELKAANDRLSATQDEADKTRSEYTAAAITTTIIVIGLIILGWRSWKRYRTAKWLKGVAEDFKTEEGVSTPTSQETPFIGGFPIAALTDPEQYAEAMKRSALAMVAHDKVRSKPVDSFTESDARGLLFLLQVQYERLVATLAADNLPENLVALHAMNPARRADMEEKVLAITSRDEARRFVTRMNGDRQLTLTTTQFLYDIAIRGPVPNGDDLPQCVVAPEDDPRQTIQKINSGRQRVALGLTDYTLETLLKDLTELIELRSKLGEQMVFIQLLAMGAERVVAICDESYENCLARRNELNAHIIEHTKPWLVDSLNMGDEQCDDAREHLEQAREALFAGDEKTAIHCVMRAEDAIESANEFYGDR